MLLRFFVLTLAFVLVRPALTAQLETPQISAMPAKNGAVILRITDSTTSATIYYTVDGSTPTTHSLQYFAPFLVSSNSTIKALAITLNNASKMAAYSFHASIPAGTLVWSDEFANTTGAKMQPDPKVWTYEGGHDGFGNHELEAYCAWDSDNSPCDSARPNAYVGTDGYLHIVAQNPSANVYTSARMKTQGLFSVGTGRVEARIWIPEGQGSWPAFWLLGNDLPTVNWPACGEQDVMEHVNGPSPDWIEGSVHGPGFIGGTGLGTRMYFPAGKTAGGWHTYGMIWTPGSEKKEGSIAYYVDDPAKPYAKFTPSDIRKFKGAIWPFDDGQSDFIILNLAVGGDWPGPPDSTTKFPSEMLFDYVRIYTN